MTRFIFTCALLGMILALEACSSGHETLKAPCPFMLGFGGPCDTMPLNQADI